jgi:regulator of nucleoside diphosphate kinase
MRENIIITVDDYDRLMGLPGLGLVKHRMSDDLLKLYHNLNDAKKLPPQRISGSVITMNSTVLLREVNSGRESEITVTYPKDADPLRRKVSVLSAIGVALLGRKENDVVSWRVPTGTGMFQIVKVTYQPEAAGDYSL